MKFKFELRQRVFFMNENRVWVGAVCQRRFVDAAPEIVSYNRREDMPLGKTHDDGIMYVMTDANMCLHVRSEASIFAKKEELLASL